jgi:hypothetical protein
MAWSTVADLNPSNLETVLGRRRKRLGRVELGMTQGTESAMGAGGSISMGNFATQIYRGKFERLQRYATYEWMDKDSDISRALDMIAEHCTDKPNKGRHNSHFQFKWTTEEATDEEATALWAAMNAWSRQNHWKTRLKRTVRNVLKYGDWFFFRNPNTFELMNIHPKFVIAAAINRETNEIIGWVTRNFKFNADNLEVHVDNKVVQDQLQALSTGATGMRNTKLIPAQHILHLSMSEGRYAGSASDDDPQDRFNNRWPFGESFLEPIYRTFKDRELLEQSYLVHRQTRAVSRLAWFIDTGRMRRDVAQWTVNNFRLEVNQSRQPALTSGVIGGERTVDSVYATMGQHEDYFVPRSSESKSEVLPIEGQPWDAIPDLEYFSEKMFRSLRVPYAWLLGPSKGGLVSNDSRSGIAYQEEIEFSRFCTDIQLRLIDVFDLEFKMYCEWRDLNINFADFDLAFNEPTDYEDSKRLARQQEALGVFSAVVPYNFISKRKLLIDVLGWNEDDITENERMVQEERAKPGLAAQDGEIPGGGLGPPPGGGAPLGAGMNGMDGMSAPMGSPAGGEMGGMDGGGLGGGGMVGSGIPAGGGGGFGESVRSRMTPLSEDVRADDIQTAPSRQIDRYQTDPTPNDQSFMADDPTREDQFHITLSVVRKIRLAQMSRRIENEKRMKQVADVYATPQEPGGLI